MSQLDKLVSLQIDNEDTDFGLYKTLPFQMVLRVTRERTQYDVVSKTI